MGGHGNSATVIDEVRAEVQVSGGLVRWSSRWKDVLDSLLSTMEYVNKAVESPSRLACFGL